MASVLDGINQRTQLVGKNRLELLMFRLGDGELYGINVFKVREVIRCPELTPVHSSHPVVRGIANIRNSTLSIMDLSSAIGAPPLSADGERYIIITEFNRSIQGFMVSSVEHIVNLNWEDIELPPEGTDASSYINAVTRIQDNRLMGGESHLVQMIDVEMVLSEVVGDPDMVSPETSTILAEDGEVKQHRILVVDDSKVACKQITTALGQVGVKSVVVNNGRQGLELLKQWARSSEPLSHYVSMVISDIEMPEMDGYTLTSEIRRDPRLKDLYVILHSSLSGVFNENMVKKVGADRFIPKFSADELVTALVPILQNNESGGIEAA